MARTALDPVAPANHGDRTGEPDVSTALRVINSSGLHLRAAAEIVTVAQAFDADITLEYRGVKVDARSVLSIVVLSAGLGATVHATGTGPEAKLALVALADLFGTGFGEGTESRASADLSRDVCARGLACPTRSHPAK
jgi:phosphocarrier protein HPr